MSLVSIEKKGGVTHVVLANPPLNILTCAAMKELTEAFRTLHAADRVAVLRGVGKHFCAGADIGEHFPEKGPALLEQLQALLASLEDSPVPVIAAVRGACLGAGLELAAGCDLMVVAEEAKLGVPEISLGVFPPAAAVDLPARIGPVRAAEMLYTGRTLSGKEAAAWGLANEAVTDAQVDEHADALAAKIASHSGAALAACRLALRDSSAALTRRAAIASACRVYLQKTITSHDGTEGLKAFLEKRKAVWADK
jgi:cyclohexa-1,5-dienecarbonyl-CoA hydratase